MRTLLEQDVVMGTFTHRTTYLPGLLDSVKRFCPEIPFIVHIADATISDNFEALRKKFLATGKRFWLFLDDDIEFVEPGTVEKAIARMIAGHYAMTGVYMSRVRGFEPAKEDMPEKDVSWLPGYFQLVDSRLVGDIGVEVNLPYPNTGVDFTYAVAIRRRGHKIGIAGSHVYHTYKPGVICNQVEDEATKSYFVGLYGHAFFKELCGLNCIVGPISGEE